MRRSPRLGVAVGVLCCTLTLSGCGDDGAEGDDAGTPAGPAASSEPSKPSGSASASTSKPAPSTAEDDAVELKVTIADGEVTPLGETVEAEVGQEIRVVVDSDITDELHVHSDPEQSFDVQPGNGQVFTFRIDEPAVYEMESHELGVVVAKLQVSQ